MSSDNGETTVITSTNSVVHYSHVQAKISIVMTSISEMHF